MQIRDTGLGFGIVTIALHWAGAALILGYLALYFLAAATGEAGPAAIRASLGITVLAVFAFRLFWRLRHYHPLPLGAVSPIGVMAARGLALGLLLAGVVLPPVEWIMIWSAGGAVGFFDLFSLPALVGPNAAVARVAGFLYRVGVYALSVGIALHILAALKHQFVLRDDTLKRMLGKHVEL